MTTNKNNTIVAICWYELSEWEILKRTAKDSETLDDSYEEWKSNANSLISEINTQGLKVEKIAVKISELESWCLENNCNNNSEARSKYAAKKSQEKKR